MENYSKQREEIIAVVKELYNHPTAEEIYVLTKKRDASVSRSTVYRNLGLLVEKGILMRIAISNGPDRYDCVEEREKHGHVICKKCGKMYDFSYNAEIERAKENITKQTGIELSDSEIIVRGICPACKQAQN